MTEDRFTRRRVLRIAGGIAPALLVVPARSGGVDSPMCPPGTKLTRYEAWTEYVNYSAEINFGRGGILGGAQVVVPVQKVNWKAVCEPADPPPPPPTPAPRSGHYLDWLYSNGIGGDLASEQLVAGGIYFNVGLPQFVQFASNSASLTMEAALPSGAVSRLTAPLVRDAGGFVFADPATADRFITQSMPNAASSSWSLSGIELSASSAGSGYVGIGMHAAGQSLGGLSMLAFCGGRDSGPGVFDPQSSPTPRPAGHNRGR